MHRFSLLVHFSLGPLNTEMRPPCPLLWNHLDPESFHRPQTFCSSLPTLDSSHLPCTWVAVSCHLFRDIPDLFCCPCLPGSTVRTACFILQMCLSNSVPSGESGASGSHALVLGAQFGYSVRILNLLRGRILRASFILNKHSTSGLPLPPCPSTHYLNNYLNEGRFGF